MSNERLQPLKHYLRGLCMGTADVVPGVSGGTVALLLGIYQRLITAITRFNLEGLGLLRKAKWLDLLRHLDASFLIPLGFGIFSGIVATSLLVHQLLDNATLRPYTWAAFFGMILASSLIVLGSVRQNLKKANRSWSFEMIAAGVLGVVVAAVIAMQNASLNEPGDPPLWFVFLGGSIGICAMVLPGVSGAMILLLIGLYGSLTGIPDELRSGTDVGSNLLILVTFAAGCATGLAVFTRLLKWLLSRFEAVTMTALCGLMVGSLPKLWPVQRDLTPEIAAFEDKQFEPIWPTSFGLETLGPFFTIVIVGATVLCLHRLAMNRSNEGSTFRVTEKSESKATA